MFAVLVYDIPSNLDGQKRRLKLYKLCRQYGYHVQASVFEFDVDYSMLISIEHRIQKIIDSNIDSVRVYSLGKARTECNVKCLGRVNNVESNDDCFLI